VNQNAFREIVSGKDMRAAARLLRPCLRVLSWGWQAVIRLRNAGYDRGWLRSYTAAGANTPSPASRVLPLVKGESLNKVPVISVGNITTGGTGKTPLVAWLCNMLSARGVRCAILTRGYRTRPGQVSDEPALLSKACKVPVVVDSDRVAGARKAIAQHGAQALICDDGFQHRRLRRDMDIVAIDATCPFGYGRMLPAGLLREPVSSLARADAVVITRFDQADDAQVRRLEQDIRRVAPGIPIAKAVHKHTHAVTAGKKQLSLDELRAKKVFAFCGIGNPKAFYDCLRQHGIALTGTRTFDDHHPYTDSDIKSLYREASAGGAEVLLCTQKDWVKSALLAPEKTPAAAYMAMELEFVEGLDELQEAIQKNFILVHGRDALTRVFSSSLRSMD
jgi:tetraacyldisaccharide 4'-kinase